MTALLGRRHVLAGAAATAVTGCAPRRDERIIRVLHIETNKAVLALWQATARAFEQANPGYNVEFRVLEAEAFRTRLATLLQSTNRPDIFYSWGGALIDIHRNAGLLEDIAPRLAPEDRTRFAPTLLSAFAREGQQFGLPYLTTEIGLIVNLALLARVGISQDDLRDWDGFIAAVAALKAAGIVPLSLGGMDRWQISLLQSHICLQLGGKTATLKALAGQDGGFTTPVFQQGTELLRALIAMDPFQPGMMSAKAQSAVAGFVRGEAAMTMHGSWFYRQAAALGVLPNSPEMRNLAFVRFPSVGTASWGATQTQGQINGWLVARGASDAAVRFLRQFVGQSLQSQLAKAGFIIPADTAAQASIGTQVLRETAARLGTMQWLQTSWPNMLGPNGAGAALDAAAGLATGQMDTAKALSFIEQNWAIEKRENKIRLAGGT